jgi:signal transduction histidine kinase
MVDSILHYTALLAGQVSIQPEPCRLIELAAIQMRIASAKAEAKGLKLAFSVEPADIEIVSDANGLIQIIDNLLDNAIKFTPAGGTIGLEITADPDAAVVRMVASDTGVGISPDRQEAIFKPFGQVERGVSREYQGVGLGLPYARQMAKLLGGSIRVESVEGQGSRFVVTLPMTA